MGGLVKPEYLYESAALKNIEIHEEIAAGVDVHASRENLIQLISILFDNAVKYASEGGYIDGSLKKSGRELVLQVKNTCEKRPEVEPEKLFERFTGETRREPRKAVVTGSDFPRRGRSHWHMGAHLARPMKKTTSSALR